MDAVKTYKLGSLFDGSGGFPLAGALCGIEPVWASEVEPYPIAVTCARFPKMKHLGDISKINGAEIEPVDIITFGSPCQDLSVAGKQTGIKHTANGDEETTRSGLFMEAVRIIKEMRKATNGEYPRFALWENVPGAFSSNKGEDFRIVCEELIKIIEPSAIMPPVPQNGWSYADSYTGDGWSLAYRVFDAQYWGVPQRRRRIHLIADFRGGSAREVLFEREGLRGYFAEGRTPWQGAPANAPGGSGANDREGDGGDRGRQLDAITLEPGIARREGGHIYEGVSGTLRANAGDNQVAVAYDERSLEAVALIDSIGGQAERGWEGDIAPTLKATHYKFPPCVAIPSAGFCTEHSAKARGIGYQEEIAPTLRVGVVPGCVYSVENHPADSRVNIDNSGKVQTLTSRMGTGGGNVPMVMEQKPVICLQGNGIDRADTAGCNGKGWKEDTSYTLNTIDRPAVVYAMDRAAFNQGQNAKYEPEITDSGINSTLIARGPSAVAYEPLSLETFHLTTEENKTQTLKARDYKDPLCAVYGSPPRYIVRRLTPTECARLQGFADWWAYIEPKDKLTEEEYRFWLEVRNTHAAVNGKKVQDYTERQMLTWYNKLYTDSAEYKMWGNGIALPPALYCMQGITDALNADDTDDWML